jgi:replicative DNA helicase
MNAPANITALCSLDLEQELLGCALINQSFDAIERLVSAGDFYEPLHSQLFETIASVHSAHGAVSYQLVAASMGSYAGTLLAEGMTNGQYLAKLAAEACLPRDVAAHARLVREFSNRRKILAAAEALTMDVYANRPAGEAASAAIEGLDEIAVQASGAAPQVSIREADDEALAIMQHRMQNPGQLAGISWGPKRLDDKTGGLKPGELIILAGRPGMGKSALGVCIANAAAKAGKPVQFFSLEMSKASLASRGMADVAFDRGPIPYFKIDNGTLSVAQAEQIIEAGRLRREWPLEIDDRGGLSVSQIAARVRKHSQKLERRGKRLGLVIIDHMNLIKPSGRYSGAKVHEVTEISGALKVLAKEMAVPILVLAQLNRNAESRDDKRPSLADLRDSGSIEQDADVVAFAFREAYYLAQRPNPDPDAVLEAKNKLEFIVAKQRGGPTGIVNLFCDIGCNAVRDLEDGL